MYWSIASILSISILKVIEISYDAASAAVEQFLFKRFVSFSLLLYCFILIQLLYSIDRYIYINNLYDGDIVVCCGDAVVAVAVDPALISLK